MHCHLRECIFDYGPLHGFWLFSFERYNGLLGEFPHNNRSIELQLMNRFIRDNSSLRVSFPEEFKKELGPLFPQAKHNVGSLLDSASPGIRPASCGWSVAIGNQYSINLPSYFSRGVFSSHEIEGLKELYSRLYSVPILDIQIPLCYRKYRTIKLDQTLIGSHKSQSSNSSLVLAFWSQELFGSPSSGADNEERPVRINYLANPSISVQSTQHNVSLFSASLFKTHPSKHTYGKPVTVWQCDLFEVFIVFYLCSLSNVEQYHSLTKLTMQMHYLFVHASILSLLVYIIVILCTFYYVLTAVISNNVYSTII